MELFVYALLILTSVVGLAFIVERSIEFTFTVPCGPDTYWAFLLRNG